MRVVTFILLVLMAGPALAAPSIKTHRLADGRHYLLATPEDTRHAPLIVALHGAAGNPWSFQRGTKFIEAATARGYAVALPAGTGPLVFLTWNAGYCCAHAQKNNVDDIAFLDRVAQDASARTGATQVFAAGMSNGAMMASAWATQGKQPVAALANVAGTLDVQRYAVTREIPFLHMHGTEDELVPFEGGKGDTVLVDVEYAPAIMDAEAFAAAWGTGLAQLDEGEARDEYTWRTREGRVVSTFIAMKDRHHLWFPGANETILDFFDSWRRPR